MKNKNILLSILFALGGGFAGLVWYLLFGCPGGNCLITSSPIITAAYMAIIGWLVGGIFIKEA